VRIDPARVDEVRCRVDEVGEGVFLVELLALFVPGAPISPPPRTWAITKMMPRSSSDSRETENPGSMLTS
jgi:hypothetical protein